MSAVSDGGGRLARRYLHAMRTQSFTWHDCACMGDGVLNFAALLQRHRQAAGLSQEELAERAGLSRRGISDLERGVRRLPHPVTVRRLAAALHLRHAEQATLLAALGRKNPAGHDTPVSGAPVSLTSFVGREHEVAEVQRLLGGRPLVSLTGA